MNTAWQQRGETRRRLRAESHNSNLRKAAMMAGKNLQNVREASELSFFWAFVHKLETSVREGDQASLYKYLKTKNLEGEQDRSSAYIKGEDGMYGHTYSKSMDQPSKVASPARCQLNRKNEYFSVCVRA